MANLRARRHRSTWWGNGRRIRCLVAAKDFGVETKRIYATTVSYGSQLLWNGSILRWLLSRTRS